MNFKYGDDPETALAAIIQGEAGGEGAAGMQAVANVINNRTKQNFSGYGADYVAQAYAPNQFQGIARPGEMARSIAHRLLTGDLSDLTGGATFYARPEHSTASWATRLNDSNAYRIGHHLFTNNQDGVPFRGPADGTARTAAVEEPGKSSGSYLVEQQQRREQARFAAVADIAREKARTIHGPASHGSFAHLHEIHGHISHLHARISDLEARIERKMRKGVVTDVDAKKHLVRMEIGRDCDGSNQVKSPWLPYSQISGGTPGLNVHSPPTVGEQVMLVNPDGSPDFSQALITRHGWYSQNPSPSIDPHSDVTVRGTTLNVRTMSTIAHSIGGVLGGSLLSTITGGITRIIDALGHHISAPGQMVDSSAKTHTHTSTDTHTDTATNSHSTVVTQGSVSHTAQQGSITNSAPLGAIDNSATTMQMSTPGTMVSVA